MGEPAESRAILGHLLNVRTPYDYTNPDWAFLSQGITELTENFEADTEDVQYIGETTKTTNTKGYTVGFDLSMGYIRNNKVQKWINKILRVPPVGSKTACDYIRFNKDEVMYGTNDQFIGARRKATVQAGSIGGSSTDSMTSEIHISGTSDPEVGYITIDYSNQNNIIYSWTPATTEPPVITSPVDGETITDSTVTISGMGLVGASVVVSYGIGKSVAPVKVDANGRWTTQIEAVMLGESPKIAAIQTNNGMGSISSDTVDFKVVATLPTPAITVPVNGTTGVPLIPTISGTGYMGATITVKSGSDTILTTAVGNGGTWSGTLETALTASTEYTIKATQSLGTITSGESTGVQFTTDSK